MSIVLIILNAHDKAMTRSFENFTGISVICFFFPPSNNNGWQIGKSFSFSFFIFIYFFIYALHYAFMSFCNPISSATLFLIDTPLALSLVYIYSYVDKCYVHRFIMMHYYEFFFAAAACKETTPQLDNVMQFQPWDIGASPPPLYRPKFPFIILFAYTFFSAEET